MAGQKDTLRERFSAEYKKYYLVDLFKRKGFVRKRCENCGKFFWTLKQERTSCDDQPCSPYTFIGSPPTKRKLDYVASWRTIEEFFKRHGHASVKRYPVVSRWRPDLFFTVASIIDFQRIEGGKVVFELPSNPLVVPQMCLRFNDIPSVGVSGKHYTSFCMVGQCSIADKEGYWKDRCIDLDFALVTKGLGIPEDEVSFVEDVWLGYGAFGYSLEYYVRGLELGNAVFTAFEGEPSNYVEMGKKVVDMGAGLERFCWITQGTPTAYDSTFSSVLKRMKEVCGVEFDEDLFLKYSRMAGRMNLDEYSNLADARRTIAQSLGVDAAGITRQFAPLEAMYAVADHSQTLLFAVADGLLPSNVGGGYNLRVLFRRAESFIRQFGFKLSLLDVANWHIDYLCKMYPELGEHRDDVAKIFTVESSRYASSVERVSKMVSSLTASKKEISTDDLVKLYDSDGVTPEQLVEAGARVSVPEDFYERVLSRHMEQKVEEKKSKFEIKGIPPTKLLFYEAGDRFEFDAKVLRTFAGGFVVLDRTAFYPRGGGQEPDHGRIKDSRVVDVEKYGGVVLHKVEGSLPKTGSTVKGEVDSPRRERIKRIHTATHILNGSSRQVLGKWVWQHSAFKEENYGRIDITHFAHLTEEEVRKIEDVANEIVMKNLPVMTTFMPRREAEERHGFRLYQGGVVPSKTIRVVNISNWDVQACGGTHTRTTGEVGFIKIVKTERIQDGVERLEFVAGHPALEYVQRMDATLDKVASVLNTQQENVVKVVTTLRESVESGKKRERAVAQRMVELSVPGILASATDMNGVRFYLARDGDLGEELVIAQGQSCVKADPTLVFLSAAPAGGSGRIVCFAGSKAVERGVGADSIVRQLANVLGGSGGGSREFAQGGGPSLDKIEEARRLAPGIVASLIKG
ncbi:MAG: alanine--tRNA ligase [Thaumarchaeota archaeon]|nr:alanine--tRNA ligase [Nitrososphaerota archaeon]